MSDSSHPAVNATVDALRTQPLALALVVINVLFLFAGLYFLHSLTGAQASTQERKDKLMAEMMDKCLTAVPPK